MEQNKRLIGCMSPKWILFLPLLSKKSGSKCLPDNLEITTDFSSHFAGRRAMFRELYFTKISATSPPSCHHTSTRYQRLAAWRMRTRGIPSGAISQNYFRFRLGKNKVSMNFLVDFWNVIFLKKSTSADKRKIKKCSKSQWNPTTENRAEKSFLRRAVFAEIDLSKWWRIFLGRVWRNIGIFPDRSP